MNEKNLKNFTHSELLDLVFSRGEKSYRAEQLFKWLFKEHVGCLDDMTNISKTFRAWLSEEGYYIRGAEVVEKQSSKDGTTKLLIEFEDGARVESVIIPEEKRMTLCVSTQTGCELGCVFCLTGESGKGRNLKMSEMIAELELAEAIVRGGEFRDFAGSAQEVISDTSITPAPALNKITNVVIMGMGEPLLNYDEVSRFIGVITDDQAMGISPRKVTLSTAGIVPEIERLGREHPGVSLAVSLNATTDEVRSRLMPINKRYPIKMLIEALRAYPLKKRGAITIEYVLIKGVNDSLEDAERLKKILRGLPCKINLIPLNTSESSDFERPTDDAIMSFQRVLLNAGLTVVKRSSRGSDISAACGQLKTREASRGQ